VFGFDAASAWYESGGIRFRLPKLDPAYESPFASGWARGLREVVTERSLLNCHGTFYEMPRSNSGGARKMRPISTHGKRITDFASWRGLLVMTGVLDDAPASDSVVKNGDNSAALWLGEADDMWRMGEPRGTGGPWMESAVTAGTPSDPYLMYGYNAKSLELSHNHGSPVTFSVEVDFLADDTWSVYTNLTVASGATNHFVFPEGFHAHWVRLVSDTTTTASGQFTYGPATVRDELMDWARGLGLDTAEGRSGLIGQNNDADPWDALAEYFYGMNPYVEESSPLSVDPSGVLFDARDLAPEQGISLDIWGTTNLMGTWTRRTDLETTGVDQSGVPPGYLRRKIEFDLNGDRFYLRLGPSYDGM
jgi:hypothetical protein